MSKTTLEPKHSESMVIQQLVAVAASGDRGAQDELFRRYWSQIQAAVRGRMYRISNGLRGREEEGDLAQDASMRILRELPKHEWQGRSQFIAWMKKVADAAIIDRHRFHDALRRSPRAENPLDSQLPEGARSPESRIDGRRAVDGLAEAMRELEPDTAAAVTLHHLGHSHAEIADLLDLNPEQLRKRIARAEVKLVGVMRAQR